MHVSVHFLHLSDRFQGNSLISGGRNHITRYFKNDLPLVFLTKTPVLFRISKTSSHSPCLSACVRQNILQKKQADSLPSLNLFPYVLINRCHIFSHLTRLSNKVEINYSRLSYRIYSDFKEPKK